MTIIQGLMASMGGPSAPPATDIDFVNPSGALGWLKGIKNLGQWTFSSTPPSNPSYTFPNSGTGKTFDFNGSTTWAISPVLADTNAWTDDQISVDIWFYPTAFGVQLLTETSSVPVNNENGDYHATVLEINSSGFVKARFYDGASATSTSPVILNQWNHVYFAEIWTGDHYFAVNGINTNGNPNYHRTRPADLGSLPERFCIGAYSAANQGNTNRFQGKLGDISISDYISPSTFSTHVNKYRPAPLALRLDAGDSASYNSGSPTYWSDTVQNTLFTLYGSTLPAYSADQGGKLTFSPGNGNYADAPSLPSAPRWTVEAWHYYDGTNSGSNPCLVTEIYGGGAINYTIGTADGSGLQVGFFAPGWATTAGTTLTAGNWYHIAGSYDGSQLRLYVNGTLAIQNGVSANAPSSSNLGIRLMKRWDLEDFWGGALSIVRIYTGALTEGNIQANFNAEKARFGL